ncbi:MAG: T9SS type A sorting domain-containing protein [Balneolaceae bacterium]
MLNRLITGLLLALLFTSPGVSQVVTDVPPNERNSRFMEDPSVITMRPGLSVAGFSNDGSVGLGLRELLNTAFESSGSSERELVLKILSKANGSISANPPVGQVIQVTNVVQYLAFEALASFVLEQNGVTSQQSRQDYGMEIREHAEVMNQFRTALVNLADNDKLVNKRSEGDPFDDYMKSVRSYNNVARALDLYLAIENAYQYFNPPADIQELLFTESEKSRVMDRFQEDIDLLFNEGLKAEYNLIGDLISATEDELEAGNRPLKGYLALGYASMSVQANDHTERDKLDGYTALALTRAGNVPSDDPRENYWMYQTGNGSRFWAEGPYYFDLVLKDAIIFWHAIRIHKEPDPSFDPFSNDWFLNPVRWLADLSTPDGSVPAIDDGNKRVIQSSNLLRWSGVYGDAEVGSTYQNLYDSIIRFNGEPSLDGQYYLVEAAIPDNSNQGNAPRLVTDPEEQQFVLRHKDVRNNVHYLYLNGEKGPAITRGEGHEQPDQLQFLYALDEYSFLVDPGYDRGSISNSFRNGYVYTNTMQYDAAETRKTLDIVTYQNEGGLESPYASVTQKRMVSIHHEAELAFDEIAPEADLLTGQVQLEFESPEPASAIYDRNLLMIKGDRPYLIDINEIKAEAGRRDFVMRYYGNSDEGDTQNGWFYWDFSNLPYTSQADRLFLYTVPLVGSYSEQNDSVSILEYENRTGPEGEKQPYPVIRKSYHSEGNTDRFATASILHILNASPSSEPDFVTDDQGLRYFTRTLDSETIDIFVFAAEHSDTPRELSLESGPLTGVKLEFKQNESIGFARLVREGSLWKEDQDFAVHLQLLVELPAPSGLTLNIEKHATGPVAHLTWEESVDPNIENYQVWKQIRNPETLTIESTRQIATTATNTFTDPGLTDEQFRDYEQRWFVRAANRDSDASGPSNYTEWVSWQDTDPSGDFELYYAYPNPLQKSTTVKFNLPGRADVTVEIFDMLGRKIFAMNQDGLEKGFHSFLWESSGNSSGTYVLRLTADPVRGSILRKSILISIIK